MEEGFEAVVVRKDSPASARTRISTEPPNQIDRLGLFGTAKGRQWWTLQLLEEQVVELKIVDRAGHSTIGRT